MIKQDGSINDKMLIEFVRELESFRDKLIILQRKIAVDNFRGVFDERIERLKDEALTMLGENQVKGGLVHQ